MLEQMLEVTPVVSQNTHKLWQLMYPKMLKIQVYFVLICKKLFHMYSLSFQLESLIKSWSFSSAFSEDQVQQFLVFETVLKSHTPTPPPPVKPKLKFLFSHLLTAVLTSDTQMFTSLKKIIIVVCKDITVILNNSGQHRLAFSNIIFRIIRMIT